MKTRSIFASFSVMFGATAFLFLVTPHAEAANRFWVGETGAGWGNTQNWSATERGAIGASVPGAGDVAIFTAGSGGTVQISGEQSLGGLSLSSTWTGSVLQGTGVLTIGASGVKMGSGRFIGSNFGIAVAGGWTQTGGIVRSIMNTMTLSGSFAVTRGDSSGIATFTSTGTIVFDGNSDQNFITGANTNMTFRNVTVNNTGAGTADDIIVNGSGSLTLSGELIITLGNFDLERYNNPLKTASGIAIADAAQATLVTDANITSSGSVTMAGATGTMTLSGSMTLTLDGVDQILDTNDTGIPNLVVSSSSGTTLIQNEVVSSALTVSAGSTLTFQSYTLSATSATITNLGTLTLNTGVLYHTPSAFSFADSAYNSDSNFTSGDVAYITLSEGDNNLDGTVVETVSVTITTAGGDSETLTLTESSVSSGIFRGSMSTGEANSAVHTGNSVIEVLNDASTTMTVSFADSNDGVTSTATATLTGAAAESAAGQSGGGGGGSGGSRRSGVIRSQDIPSLSERRYTTGEVVTQEEAPSAPVSPITSDVPWSDLSEDHPFANAAITLYEAGIVKGNDDGTVKLDRSLSRIEALALLMRTINAEPRPETPLPFGDVDSSAWYAESLQVALAKKIVKGFPDNTFRPSESLNLVQSLKLICIGLGLASQDDETRAFQWYDPYVTVGREAGLISGDIDTGRDVTRGEFFGWLVKVLEQ